MTTTFDLLNRLHKKQVTNNHAINQFYFNESRNPIRPTQNSNNSIKRQFKKITYQADRVSISPSPISSRSNKSNASKISVSKQTTYNKKTSSPLYRTINSNKTQIKSPSKDSRSITPSSRSISVNRSKPVSKTKFRKTSKSPISKLNNLHTISNIVISSKTPANNSLRNGKRKTPSPLRINTSHGKSPVYKKTPTPSIKKSIYSIKCMNNRTKTISKSKSPREIRTKKHDISINHSKINSISKISNSSHSINKSSNNMIHINLAKRKQNIKPKANGNNTVYQPLGSSYNFCTISKENMKKILPNNNKSKNHFRHISITTGIKVNNNLEEQLLKSTSSRNSTPNQGSSVIKAPISVVNSTRTGSISTKSLYVTKKIFDIAFISKTGLAGASVKSTTPKVNQDNLFIQTYDDINMRFIGVCDGHGTNGHLVSEYLKKTLPPLLHKELKERVPLNTNQSSQSSLVPSSIHKSIENAFILTNSKLSNNINIDTNFSGSTCVSLIISHEGYYSANVGDSRAIKGIYINSKWGFETLTRDHKATEPDEAKRVIRFGGRIESFKETDGSFVGPKRVWLLKEQIPGLAMTRSFGDQVASSVGVVCEPEIKDFYWKEEDKFIVIASDGLWEYVTNKEVAEIVGQFTNGKSAQRACNTLYNLAHQRWKENDDCIDDITIIVMFLD